jgi:sarcosine oxidase
MQSDFEYIVLGCGGIGSGAAYWLARRAGKDVLCLEQFKLGHDNGGSQDHSRIIRLMYHDAKYTALTPHTYQAWATVEEESGVELVVKCGGVEIAEASGRFRSDIDRYAAAMDAANIAYERLDHDELRRRFPQFQSENELMALYEAHAGIVNAAKGIATHVALARGYGATILDQTPVRRIVPNDRGAVVETDAGTFSCRKLVIAAGAWSARLLGATGLHLPVTVTQEQITYYATPHLKEFSPKRFPIFIWKDQFDIYGFPVYGEVATKAGLDAAGPAVTPDTRSFEPDPERERFLDEWLGRHIPHFLGPKLYSKTCLYTMPPDRDFVIDTLPGHPNVILCIGAGHAYKFASLLGQILSELALDGHTKHDITPFSLQRPAITDPNYVNAFRI